MADWREYMELDGPHNTKPEILATAIGAIVYWERKRDGSNISIMIGDDGDWHIYTRNQEAERSVYDEVIALIAPLQDNIYRMLGQRYIGYFELCRKGKSPAQFEINDSPELLLIDIFDTTTGKWIAPELKYDFARSNNVPYIDDDMRSVSDTFEHFKKTCDEFIERAHTNGWEGYVAKWIDKDLSLHAIKCKVEYKYPTTKPVKEPKKADPRPLLEMSEVSGAIDKARNDLGTDKFREPKHAMPLIAKYVHDEEVKHGKRNVLSLFQEYQRYLGGIV